MRPGDGDMTTTEAPARPEDAELDYALFDADNHYYEPRDCFSRHIEAPFRDRAIRPVVRDDGREVLFFGDDELVFPTVKFDKCEPPGALREILRSAKYRTFEEARSDIGRRVIEGKSRLAIQKYLDQLRAQADIKWRNTELQRAYEQALAKRRQDAGVTPAPGA